MAENKKVIGATSVEYNGISFRSKLEERIYKKLVSLGYSPEYEIDHHVLWNGFRPKKIWYLDGISQTTKKGVSKIFEDWKYTPDFILRMNDYTFYIEAKGNPNDLWPYKRKLFLKTIEDDEKAFFFEVKTIKGLLKSLEIMKQISKQ